MSEQHTTQPREGQPPLDELLGERQHLLNVAFRMLGAMNDAEDVVQETYARWFRLEEAERERIEIPAAWLTRVAARICLDVLGSARHRREQYVGEWLPEPTPETRVGAGTVTADPLERVTLDDSVTMALLVVLESLTPAERVAFVLHDVFALPFEEIAEIVGRTPQACRKLASSARRHVRDGRAREVSPAVHTRTVRAFWDACQTGDVTALLAVLDPDVVARSDGAIPAGRARQVHRCRPEHGTRRGADRRRVPPGGGRLGHREFQYPGRPHRRRLDHAQSRQADRLGRALSVTFRPPTSS
jgi:RNA polymerase sigma-70 factor (ECF subfamily)